MPTTTSPSWVSQHFQNEQTLRSTLSTVFSQLAHETFRACDEYNTLFKKNVSVEFGLWPEYTTGGKEISMTDGNLLNRFPTIFEALVNRPITRFSIKIPYTYVTELDGVWKNEVPVAYHLGQTEANPFYWLKRSVRLTHFRAPIPSWGLDVTTSSTAPENWRAPIENKTTHYYFYLAESTGVLLLQKTSSQLHEYSSLRQEKCMATIDEMVQEILKPFLFGTGHPHYIFEKRKNTQPGDAGMIWHVCETPACQHPS